MKLILSCARILPVGFLILSIFCLTSTGVRFAPLPPMDRVGNIYNSGVTDSGGQGANITRMLHWWQVTSFGGS